jgi:hypothetical protein
MWWELPGHFHTVLPDIPERNGAKKMGRTLISIHLSMNEMAERWARASRTLTRDDLEHGKTIADMAKMHGSGVV